MEPEVKSPERNLIKLNFKFGRTAQIAAAVLAVATLGKLYHTSKQMVPVNEIPKNFKVQGEWFTIGEDFKLKGVDGTFARIDQQVLNLTPCFRYRDHNYETKAVAKQKLVSFGTEIRIYDESDHLLGSIEERVFSSMLKATTTYDIKDSTGKFLATSGKIDFLGTSISIRNDQNEVVATMNRSAFDIGKDTWSCELKESNIDPRLLVFIPAYKSYVDSTRE